MIVVGCICLLLPAIYGVETAGCSEGSPVVAVLPFEVLSQEDLSFLGKGVSRMICSRIGDSMEISVQCSVTGIPGFGNNLTPEELRKLREKKDFQSIDYLVRGTLTVAGGGISTDVELIDLVKGVTTASFHQAGPGQEDVLRHASVIAGNIKNTLLGKPMDSFPDGQSGSGLVMGMTPQPLPANSPVMGPSQSVPSGTPVFSPQQGQSSSNVSVQPQVFRSRNFDTEFRGLATGDVDGDGINEIVVIDDHTLMVFSIENGALSQKSAFKGNYYQFMKSVDVADINGNGRAEVFVSVTDRNGGFKSFVVEWDGGRFRSLTEDADWFFRIIKTDRQPLLFGQKGSHSDYFSGPVHSLSWDGKGYSDSGTPPIRQGLSIFSFSIGSLLGDGTLQSLALDRDGFLDLSDASGRSLWVSSEPYALTPLFLEKGGSRLYINGRILVSDLIGDQRPEVIVEHNRDMSRGYLGRFRKFTRASVKLFAWNGRSLDLLMETAEIKGYVCDVATEDLDRDGYNELIYAVGIDTGKLIRTSNSYIIIEKFR